MKEARSCGVKPGFFTLGAGLVRSSSVWATWGPSETERTSRRRANVEVAAPDNGLGLVELLQVGVKVGVEVEALVQAVEGENEGKEG